MSGTLSIVAFLPLVWLPVRTIASRCAENRYGWALHPASESHSTVDTRLEVNIIPVSDVEQSTKLLHGARRWPWC